MLARDQLRQIFRLLLAIPPAAELVDAEVRMGAVAEPDRGRGPRHFLLRDDMLEIAEAEAAIFLLDGDAVEAECAHFGPKLARKPVLRVDLRGERGNAVGGEARGGLADRIRHLAEREVQPEIHARLSCWPRP